MLYRQKCRMLVFLGKGIWIEFYNYYRCRLSPKPHHRFDIRLGGWKEKIMTSMNQGNTNRATHTPTSATSPMNTLNTRQTPLGSTSVGIAPKFVPTLNEDDAVVQARLLKALADPTRLRILSLLSRHE